MHYEDADYDSSDAPTKCKRTVLTDIQARNIFEMKSFHFAGQRGSTSKIAQTYGVSPKTIRDIWAGRTWYRATYTLDRSKPASVERLQTKIGRPLGAKDQQPRRSKIGSSPISCKPSCQRAIFANRSVYQPSHCDLSTGEAAEADISNAEVVMMPSIDMEERNCIEKFQLNTEGSISGRNARSSNTASSLQLKQVESPSNTALPDLRVGMEIEAFLQQEQWIPSAPGELDPFHSDLIVFWSHMGFQHCTH